MARTILIDADILVYTTASVNEEPTEFANGIFVLWADAKKAKQDLDEGIDKILQETDGDDYILCLTDKENFRKDILPSYKGNRTGTRRPMLLPALRQHCIDNHRHMIEAGLEGDDIMGLLASDPEHGDEYVIYSIDKDMKTIPNANLWDHEDGMVRKVSQGEADFHWFSQALTGDTTDGYKGCPRIGPVAAEKILNDDCSFEAVVKAFEKAHLSIFEATQQAQVARILRHGDYDFETKKLNVWSPS